MAISFKVLILIWALVSADPSIAAIEFNKDIRPILSSKCFQCHGPDKNHREAELRLDTREGAINDNDGVKAIDPENLNESEILFRIHSKDSDEMMPPPESKKELSDKEKSLLDEWIKSGGNYEDHWAFERINKFNPPQSALGLISRNPIDSFIHSRLPGKGLKPMPEAGKSTLIRRVTFDLTGLPPTIPEVDFFLADDSPEAYEKVVDRLLGSESYGERMALAWMDAARYGDSSVMHADGPRYMWPWRDWVINAYNSNMSFKQFTIEQLAGDLIPNATVDQKVASGFNRNHATSDEGGAIPEELRVEYVVDRVKTTANVWMGLTMECSQCHDHKYDPITQKEYYQMFAYFNNTTDPGMQTRNGNQSPTVTVPDRKQVARLADLEKRIALEGNKLESYKRSSIPQYVKWLREAEKGAGDALPEPAGLKHFFPLDEIEGNVIKAQIGGGVGKLSGKLSKADRGGGSGLRFDGKSSFVFDNWPERKRESEFTFAAWLKLPANGSGSVLARMDEDNSFRGYDLWVQGRAVGTHIISKWPVNALKVVSDKPLAENKWQHVAVTYDGSSKASGVKIYIDGQLAGNKVEQDSLKDSIITKTPFKLGSRSKSANFNGEVDELRIYDKALSEDEVKRLGGDPIKSILATSKKERTKEQKMALLNFYLNNNDPKYKELAKIKEALLKKKAGISTNSKVTSMIMQDNPEGKTRLTFILNRGQYDQPIKKGKGAEIKPGVPSILPELDDNAPKNRLSLAKWMTDPSHPLTARVAVNRYWALFFGRGIVKTSSDFGNQGSPPTHPKLLDWLANDFVENGWNIKRTVRQIVTSATYRQQAHILPDSYGKDPQNLLLARSSRFRLQGEFIRDSALSVSSLLVESVGGPSVKPYQPVNIWNEVSLNGGLRYKRDSGEKLYRRSMYTYWKRSAPMPNMLIFDAPTREKCLIQRPITNTPLQALVVLNDPQFVESARAFAQRIISEGDADERSRMNYGFKLALSREATDEEFEVLKRVLNGQASAFSTDKEKAKKFLSIGESTRNESIDIVEHAAWTVIAQMILNMDETLTRG
ncbi:MAG TPA: DUF1553 domain-containing protein [Verrucomicrobia bacterium]|nr:DUF1553 domain-containing protein [Verrucomicrobiales bacterium]HIL55893.1 DUF1553 domain-containing protein [Verrucomicrobiota bacterium]